jgi:hypothetical protein
VYYVVAIHGRRVVLSQFPSEGEALRDHGELACPSLVVRVVEDAAEVIAARELSPAQVDEALLQAIKRVCRQVPSGT